MYIIVKNYIMVLWELNKSIYMSQKLWINKKHKQRVRVRGLEVLPKLDTAKVLETFHDREQSIKIMIVLIENQHFIFSLMWDGDFEQGELIPVPNKVFGLKMISRFKGFLYGSTTN